MKMTRFFRRQDIKPKWFLVDLEGAVVGRACTTIADILRGKHRSQFTPNGDTGDYVVVINAEKAVYTGTKETNKRFYRHSFYPGGLYSRTVREQREKDASKMIYHGVKGMLPKNKLGLRMIQKLKVFNGAEHIHSAQSPEVLTLAKTVYRT